MEGLDVGGLVILGIGILFLVLVGAVIRKMARGQVEAGETQEQLEPGEGEPADARAAPDPEPAPAPDAEPAPEALAGALPAATQPAVPEPVAPPEPEPEPEPEAEAAVMRRGLSKSRKGFMAKLNALITGGDLDEDLVDELEALLVTSDIGVKTTERLLADLRGQLTRKEIGDPDVVRAKLEAKIREIVKLDVEPMTWDKGPTVMMVIGVNGVGKTTTIGKLAARLTREGKTVVLGAGDTFRAAAVEQLEVWGERAGAEVVKGEPNADPASVLFNAVQRAQAVKADVCIADTAGRLHTKVNLMEELKKVRRVMNKAMPGAPHEVMMVLDATTGQNAIQQAKQFKAAVEMNSIALTKLDGTAKGGVVVAICDELEIPVRFVGIGEQVDDLRDFDPDAFVEALFSADPA